MIVAHYSSSTSSTLGVRSRFRGALPLFPGVRSAAVVDDGAGVVGGAVLVFRLAPSVDGLVEEEEEDFFDFFFLVYFVFHVMRLVLGVRECDGKDRTTDIICKKIRKM